ncbi:rRNA N6-adenosine-methyltransferase ZCCHC4-like [Lineus longissimus]|uniref:rRNA N6-adenosine-methyltransferase ZCCHC4-like n=1 Tax=Lineus longissimus TaxID=88925 RepID=UPI002B4F1884
MPKENSCGVDVCLESPLENAPHCPHGPTLLFQRYIKQSAREDATVQKFYACSACRDRKDCSFFQQVGEKVSEAKLNAREDMNRKSQPPNSHREYYTSFEKAKLTPASSRTFCQTCNVLLIPKDKPSHQDHKLLSPVTDADLQKPSHLLKPLDNKKTNAQYLFSDETVSFMLSTFRRLGFTHVLCVGSPRIFEAISSDESSLGMQALLLDIDHRYQQFFSPDHFCRYNMFNHHFFGGEESKKIYTKFLRNEKLVVVTDPPFGGLVEVIAFTVKKIMQEWKVEGKHEKNLPLMWIFPYFMEKKIEEFLPTLTMLDYKVDYSNHAVFHGGPMGRKQGSPVRIFTNIPPIDVILPEDSYKLCARCQRYVSKQNVHCDVCDACTSKDGGAYVHCFKCETCVKSSRVHCNKCNCCELPDHSCGRTLEGCHICGEMDHKRRDCPNKNSVKVQKRHDESQSVEDRPRKKKRTEKPETSKKNNAGNRAYKQRKLRKQRQKKS